MRRLGRCRRLSVQKLDRAAEATSWRCRKHSFGYIFCPFEYVIISNPDRPDPLVRTFSEKARTPRERHAAQRRWPLTGRRPKTESREYSRRHLDVALSWVFERLSLKSVGFSVLGVSLCVYLAWESSKPVVILDPVIVPKQLSDAGFTSDVATQRVKEKLEEIRTVVEAVPLQKILTSNADPSLPDIEIPETKISAQTVIDIFRNLLGNEPKHLSGEITSSEINGMVEVRCRLLQTGALSEIGGRRQLKMSSFDTLVESLGQEFMAFDDPYDLGQYLIARRDLKGVSDLARRLLVERSNTDNMYAKAHMLQSLAAGARHEPELAVNEAKTALQFAPEWTPAHTVEALALEQANRLADAEKEFRWCIAREERRSFIGLFARTGRTAYLHHDLAAVLDGQHRPELAVKEYREAIRLNPTYAYPHDGLADVLDEQHDREGAISEYRKAIALDPKFEFPHYKLASILTEMGQASEADNEYQRAMYLDPGDPDVHIQLANSLDSRHRYDSAVAEYQLALKMDPHNEEAHVDLADTLRKQGKLRIAAQECLLAINLDPFDADAHTNLGDVLRDEHELSDAAAEYRTASRLDPSDGEPHHSLALILELQGKFRDSQLEFQRAHELNPTSF